MVSQTSFSGVRADYFNDWQLEKARLSDVDASSESSIHTVDEALDFEELNHLEATDSSCIDQHSDDEYNECSGGVSGLPLVCSNCGVSFFSLQIHDDQMDCYCSGECKWSVIMYREMDMRMFAMRRPMRRYSILDTMRLSTNFHENYDYEEHEFSLTSSSKSGNSTSTSSCS
ncbi:hypothetical protein CCR75_000234 [Bremia lactucae]|uniref:Uncharacterized protein n=1 Tax=Bremia lactucae TaxID=4779 RepID=A0A976FDT5_BRELC|nr:hypothetical protein CCR75_000234 [Bremia lactucae]